MVVICKNFIKKIIDNFVFHWDGGRI